MVPDLQHRSCAAVIQRSSRDAQRHDDQADAENRVQLADDLVDGEQRRQEIVDQNHNRPELHVQGLRRQQGDQPRRAYHKHNAHHHQQNHRENPHDHCHDRTQVFAYDLRDGRAVVALGEHAGEIVVDAPCENSAEHNPDVDHRPPQRAAERSENRAKPRDVQKLNQKRPAGGHGHEVHVVLHGVGRGLPAVRVEHPLHKAAIKKITGNQQYKSSKKRYHIPDLLRGNAGFPPTYTQYYLSIVYY